MRGYTPYALQRRRDRQRRNRDAAKRRAVARTHMAIVDRLLEARLQQSGPTFSEVLDHTCKATGAVRARVLLGDKYRASTDARALVAKLAHELCGMSWPEVANAFGKKSHSTFLAAAHRVDKRDALRHHYETIAAKLKSRLVQGACG